MGYGRSTAIDSSCRPGGARRTIESQCTPATDQDKAAVVHNGYQPEREILTGIGAVSVKIPKVRSKDGEPVSFHSALVPPYIRKSRSLEAAFPWLYFRDEQTKLCALVIMGVNERGEKRFLAIEDGVRESTQSWREVLLDLKSRGLNSPKLAIGDGVMGFWSALDEVYPDTGHQRCWVHKKAA